MPAIIPAVAGAFAASATGTLIAGALGATATAVVSGLAGAVVASGVGKVLGIGEEPPSAANFASVASGALVNTAGTVDQIPIVYGSRRVGGTRVLTEVTGDNNENLHLVYVHCEGEVDSIAFSYLDDVVVQDDRYAGHVTVDEHNGADDQVASASLVAAVSGWTTNHRLRGLCYSYVLLTYDEEAFSGLPNYTVDIDGKLVYDPRAGSPTLTAWSDNPALCILDYLTNSRYGRGVPLSAVDLDTFEAAADYCDELVSVPATGSPSFTTQKRYTCNGLIAPDNGLMDNMRALLTSCRGALVYSGGVYKLVLDQAQAASGFEFTEDNIVGGWIIKRPGKRDRVNRVRARFFNPDRSWQPDIAIVESSTFRTEDNGIVLERELDLPFTADLYMAKQIAGIELKQSRIGIVAQFTAVQEALRCEVGDVVAITHGTPGWDGKLFRILEIELTQPGEVRVTAREYDATVYDLDSLSVKDAAPTTNLPNPFDAPAAPTGVTVTQSTKVWDSVVVSWTASANVFVTEYQAEYKLATDSAWSVMPRIRDTAITINKLLPRVYHFRAKAFNTIGKGSAYTATTSGTISGPTGNHYGSFTGLGYLSRMTQISVGGSPVGIEWCPSNNLVYLCCFSAGRIDVINPVNDQVIDQIDVDITPQEIFYCPQNNRLYCYGFVGSPFGSEIVLINPETNAVERSFSIDFGVAQSAYCAHNQTIYVQEGMIDPADTDRRLVLPGASGNYASTPDAAPIDITGDIDIQVDCALDDWTPASAQILLAKFLTTGNQRSYALYISTTGLVRFVWSTAGTSGTTTDTPSTVAPTVENGERLWVRATMRVATGSPTQREIKFYTSSDGISWTQLGATVTGAATSIFNSTALLEVGSNDTGTASPLKGRVYRARVFNGIQEGSPTPSPAAEFIAADFAELGTSAASSTTGETWTVNTSGTVTSVISDLLAARFNLGGTGGVGDVLYCPSNKKIYIPLPGDDVVKVVDPDVQAVIATVSVGNTPQSLCYCPDNDRIYVANTGGESVSVINPKTNTVVATIGGSPTLFNTPDHIIFSPLSRLIYVTNLQTDEIATIQPSTNTVLASAEIGTDPTRLLWVPTAAKLYVGSDTENIVNVVAV